MEGISGFGGLWGHGMKLPAGNGENDYIFPYASALTELAGWSLCTHIGHMKRRRMEASIMEPLGST